MGWKDTRFKIILSLWLPILLIRQWGYNDGQTSPVDRLSSFLAFFFLLFKKVKSLQNIARIHNILFVYTTSANVSLLASRKWPTSNAVEWGKMLPLKSLSFVEFHYINCFLLPMNDSTKILLRQTVRSRAISIKFFVTFPSLHAHRMVCPSPMALYV